MLFIINIITDTRELSIFNTVKSYFTINNIPLNNIIACGTDGAPSVVSRYRRFVVYLKEDVPNIFIVLCAGNNL